MCWLFFGIVLGIFRIKLDIFREMLVIFRCFDFKCLKMNKLQDSCTYIHILSKY